MGAAPARITIDVDLQTTPIEGWLTADGGVPQRFAGYMQLVTALEATLQAAR